MTNVPMTRPEDALAIHEQNYGHSVCWVQLPDGRVLLSGGGEFRTSDDGGMSWSEPFTGQSEGDGPTVPTDARRKRSLPPTTPEPPVDRARRAANRDTLR